MPLNSSSSRLWRFENVTASERRQNLFARRRLIKRVEMQAGDAVSDQFPALPDRPGDTDLELRGLFILNGFQTRGEFRGKDRSTQSGDPFDAGERSRRP